MKKILKIVNKRVFNDFFEIFLYKSLKVIHNI